MALRAAIVVTILSTVLGPIDCFDCPNSSGNSLPQDGQTIANGTLTYFNLLKPLQLDIPAFSYSLGRCLQASVQCDTKEMNISISCLNSRIKQTYSRKVYASSNYVSHEFATDTNGYRSFELFICLKKPYRYGWIVVNQEPKWTDGPTINWSRIKFPQECGCNFKIDLRILYTDPPVGLRNPKKIKQNDFKEKSYWIATGIVAIALIILVLCVACSYF